MERLGAVAAIVLLSGCGAPVSETHSTCSGECPDTVQAVAGELADSPERSPGAVAAEGPAPVVVPAASAPPGMAPPLDADPLDRFLLPGVDAGLPLPPDYYIFDLLSSLFLDDAFLEPVPRDDPPMGFSFLELLCRRRDIGDVACRQRYGEFD